MKYLVMECGLSYAIVLDEDGRFLKVPNLDYEVGQIVENIVQFPETETIEKRSFLKRNIRRLTAAAACFCLVVIGSQQVLFSTYGTVRMQINPDVLLSVNRMDYVTDIDGLNADGEDLIEGYRSFGKKVDIVSDELSVLAMEKGYLDENGQIRFTVESEHEEWKRTTEELLIAKISVHLPESIEVKVSAPKTEISIPVYVDDNRDDDDQYDDDWDDDRDDWDDDRDDWGEESDDEQDDDSDDEESGDEQDDDSDDDWDDDND